MKNKSRKIDKKRGPSAVARKAGVSRQLASRKLGQGKSPGQIVREAEFERAKRTGRTEARAAALKVNGHDGDFPPFTDSQKAKEFWLSKNRELEYKVRSRELAETEVLQRWIGDVLSFCMSGVQRWVEWSGSKFGLDVQQWLDRETRQLSESVQQYARLRARTYRIRLPPPLPPEPPHERLAYYERYVRGSVSGELEQIPQDEQLGSYEWRQRHPEFTDQQMFELMQKKKEWDKEMAQLLVRRGEWDVDSGAAESPLPKKAPPPE